jgi:hypothetical protein
MKTATPCGTVTADDRRRIRLPDEYFTDLPTRKLQWVKVGRQLVLEPAPEPDLKRIRKIIARVKEFRRKHPITAAELNARAPQDTAAEVERVRQIMATVTPEDLND